jgi:hypothetical protein
MRLPQPQFLKKKGGVGEVHFFAGYLDKAESEPHV